MSSVLAHLAYGYDLGGPFGWRLRGMGPQEALRGEWFNEFDGDDFVEAADRQLRRHGPATGGGEDLPCQVHQQVAAVPDDKPTGDRYLLVVGASVRYNLPGQAETIDLGRLVVAPGDAGWDELLRRAVQALGIEPVDDAPRWLLYTTPG